MKHSALDDIDGLSDEVTKLKDLLVKKMERIELAGHEKTKVVEAKLKKLIKDSTAKSQKGITAAGEAVNTLGKNMKTLQTNMRELRIDVAKLKAMGPGPGLPNSAADVMEDDLAQDSPKKVSSE